MNFNRITKNMENLDVQAVIIYYDIHANGELGKISHCRFMGYSFDIELNGKNINQEQLLEVIENNPNDFYHLHANPERQLYFQKEFLSSLSLKDSRYPIAEISFLGMSDFKFNFCLEGNEYPFAKISELFRIAQSEKQTIRDNAIGN